MSLYDAGFGSVFRDIYPFGDSDNMTDTPLEDISSASIAGPSSTATTNVIVPSANEDEIELRSLISTWQVDNIADHLINQNVFIPILKIIKRHQIERLLRIFDMGTQIKFEHYLEEWRELLGIPLHSDKASTGYSTPSTSYSREATPTRCIPYRRPSTAPDDYIPLANVLNETPKGIMLTEYYNKFTRFSEEQRTLLIGLIATFYEEKSVPLTLASSHRIEQEILARFSNEKLEFYRIGKRGKIYNKYCNMKSSFKSAVSSHILPPKKKSLKNKTRHENEFESEENAESCIRCLKYDNLSSEEFDSVWKACSQFRINQIKEETSTITSIMEVWPYYKIPSGYRLIDIDFGLSFNNRNGLILHWENYWSSILNFLNSDNNVKDKKAKALLETISSTPNLPENGRNAAIFWALHGYFVPTKVVVSKTGTKRSSLRYTIRDSQEAFVFIGRSLQEVEDHILHLKSQNVAVQPFIYCVGDDIINLSGDVTVYFDGIRYNFKNFVRAVDICFKIIYLFDLEFPTQCISFYSFLESFFYEFKPKNNTSKVHILSDYLRNHC
ncbi:hypothetical protein PPYR_06799 [Photinus pyralis]|uniref:Uncharacterized protein n=2 Tax=Photinus pyralis TaxID=7054 RepID=A0A5N4ANL4_PHOPY|nr:uncharacterized protein LOC116168709 [Photinus pyralis]KAB0798919.1 hypothetical protein PPYR_06799 [Photinus pyralis]